MANVTLFRRPKVMAEGNSIADAERFGNVEIGYTTFKKRREVRIEMGAWGKMHCHVWGTGKTIEQACGEAIKKAKCVQEWFPHPDKCV